MIDSLEEFKIICKKIFKNLLEKDLDLIKNCNYEPTISGRIAMYFRECFVDLEKENIFVDVEYDKFGLNDKKRSIQSNGNSNNIRPDILIHERTTQNKNLLYCEIKKDVCENASDKNKVKEQVDDKNYKFGLFINKIKEENIDFQIYTNSIWNKYSFKNDEILEITNE